MNTIVLDVGSSITKAGFAGDPTPCVVTPTLIGKPKQRNVMPWINTKSTFVGIEAELKRGISTIKHPIRRGVVESWDDLELLYNVTFSEELCVEPEEQPLLITQAPGTNREDSDKSAEMLFERFNVPALCIDSHAIMYAMDRPTATVIDIGDGITCVRPICEGSVMPHAITRVNLGGSDCTDYLKKIITSRGYFLQTRVEREIVRDMKEKLGYVSLDYEGEMKKSRESSVFNKTYELPDGSCVTIGNERFRCSEVLFQPHLITSVVPGIHHIIYDTIQKCEIDMRRALLENVIIIGGSTLFPDFNERLKHELKLLSVTTEVKVVAHPERMVSQWIGASILGNLSTFLSMCVTNDEYQEYGPDLLHKKLE